MYLLYLHKVVSCKSLVVGLSCLLLVGEVAIASPPNQCEGLLPDAIGEPRARSDGSFVIRRDPGSIRVPALGEEGDVGPAPRWIEDHPGTDLYFIRGMRGYALAPDYHPDSRCEHEISVFAADGTFCGSFAPEPHPNCGYDSYFSIGEDGTVFHPTRDPVPCGFETCVCARHYWVGLLQ